MTIVKNRAAWCCSCGVHQINWEAAVEIGAGRFKAQCLQLMDLVHDTHQQVVITKHGRPVAQLVAASPLKPRPVYGRLKGRIASASDLIAPLPGSWHSGDGNT